MSRSEDIPLSALQHWLFCPRQYALIHLERVWAENAFTAEGRVLHERSDAGQPESRQGIRILRSVEIHSARHGLHGVADVVELRGGRPYPVEYKRGKPKSHRADEVQLCAQALCLEEMFECEIAEGALFYGAPRRRTYVAIDAALRRLTLDCAKAIRECHAAQALPAPIYERVRCDRCSLLGSCNPKLGGRRSDVSRWLTRTLDQAGTPE